MIAPAFYRMHRALRDGDITHFWLPGGRGSGKSSAVSIEILLGIMRDPMANAVVMRKVGKNLRDIVYGQERGFCCSERHTVTGRVLTGLPE